MRPRWYQSEIITKVFAEWEGENRTLVVVSPPRSGKTPTAVWISEPFIKASQHVVFIAHREELVRQASMTWAAFGHNHNIVAPDDVIADIVSRQSRKYGRSFYDQNAKMIIGSVQTMGARSNALKRVAGRVALWIVDEAHHVLSDNQWGKVIGMFPNARGVGFTATPGRTDRKSLAKSQGGVFDAMVRGVTARQLMDEGYICKYRIIAPPPSINRELIKVGSSGDFTQKSLSDAKRESTITGDCIRSYREHGAGKQAVVFAVDLAHAHDLTEAYRAEGISAESVSGKTPKAIRKAIMDKFERGVFKILVNVDLFGEGLDVNGIEVVVMARPTQSFVLYVQQFFRALTAGRDKHEGVIIDHVGNVEHFGRTHGLPDTYNNWTLETEVRGKRDKPDEPVIPITTCEKCFSAYEAVKPSCPFCGFKPTPAQRSKPEHVDGDLIELDQETLDAMCREIRRIDSDPVPPTNLSGPGLSAMLRRWSERQVAQQSLRDSIALWAGYWRDRGESDSEIYRRFWFVFQIDILSAQAQNTSAATELKLRIDADLEKCLKSGNCQ